MKRIIYSLIFIFSAFIFSISAQTALTKKSFEGGIISAKNGEFETALKQFQTSLALAANDEIGNDFLAKIHFNIGVCHYRMKNQAEAIGEFERAVLLEPSYEKAFYALGMAQFELGNFDESEKAFRGAIRLNEKNGENWFDLAFVYLVQKDYDSAKFAFEKAIEFKSVSSAVGRNNIGVILAMNGNFSAAIREFEIAVKNSRGKLNVAERNLQFCRSYRQNVGKDLIAKLEFSKN